MQAEPISEKAIPPEAEISNPIFQINEVIADFYTKAIALEPTDPKGARWLRSKARFLERGVLTVLLDYERERQRLNLRSNTSDPWRDYKYDFDWHVACSGALVQLSQNALRVAAFINVTVTSMPAIARTSACTLGCIWSARK
jgi:hypothetical protein